MVRITLREKPPNYRHGLFTSMAGSNQIAAGPGRWVHHGGNAAVIADGCCEHKQPSSQKSLTAASGCRFPPEAPLMTRYSADLPPPLYRPRTKTMGVRSSAPPMA